MSGYGQIGPGVNDSLAKQPETLFSAANRTLDELAKTLENRLQTIDGEMRVLEDEQRSVQQALGRIAPHASPTPAVSVRSRGPQ